WGAGCPWPRLVLRSIKMEVRNWFVSVSAFIFMKLEAINIAVRSLKKYNYLHRMKKISLGLAVIVVIFVGFVAWWTQQLKPISADKTPQRFVVVRGETSADIAKKLEDQKLLRS